MKHKMVWVLSKSRDIGSRDGHSRDATRVLFIGLSNFELESFKLYIELKIIIFILLIFLLFIDSMKNQWKSIILHPDCNWSLICVKFCNMSRGHVKSCDPSMSNSLSQTEFTKLLYYKKTAILTGYKSMAFIG